MEYEILSTSSVGPAGAAKELTSLVQSRIRKGWMPLGGVGLAIVPGTTQIGARFCMSQAMVFETSVADSITKIT